MRGLFFVWRLSHLSTGFNQLTIVDKHEWRLKVNPGNPFADDQNNPEGDHMNKLRNYLEQLFPREGSVRICIRVLLNLKGAAAHAENCKQEVKRLERLGGGVIIETNHGERVFHLFGQQPKINYGDDDRLKLVLDEAWKNRHKEKSSSYAAGLLYVHLAIFVAAVSLIVFGVFQWL